MKIKVAINPAKTVQKPTEAPITAFLARQIPGIVKHIPGFTEQTKYSFYIAVTKSDSSNKVGPITHYSALFHSCNKLNEVVDAEKAVEFLSRSGKNSTFESAPLPDRLSQWEANSSAIRIDFTGNEIENDIPKPVEGFVWVGFACEDHFTPMIGMCCAAFLFNAYKESCEQENKSANYTYEETAGDPNLTYFMDLLR